MATFADICLLLRLKHWSVRGASRHSAFMASSRLSATRVGLSPRFPCVNPGVRELNACGMFVDD